ncbi:hypothetical protein PV392_05415 [Streptomyces sp. ME03-5709C]|nr:hypothetical protein [Streptomyces sp. ME03-5709C]
MVAGHAAGTGRLRLDAEVKASLDRSGAMTGAPHAWRKGLDGDGDGVRVAVLDPGTIRPTPS